MAYVTKVPRVVDRKGRRKVVRMWTYAVKYPRGPSGEWHNSDRYYDKVTDAKRMAASELSMRAG